MPCLKAYGNAILIYSKVLSSGPEAASEVVQLSFMPMLHPVSEQQMGGGCQYQLHRFGAWELEL